MRDDYLSAVVTPPVALCFVHPRRLVRWVSPRKGRGDTGLRNCALRCYGAADGGVRRIGRGAVTVQSATVAFYFGIGKNYPKAITNYKKWGNIHALFFSCVVNAPSLPKASDTCTILRRTKRLKSFRGCHAADPRALAGLLGAFSKSPLRISSNNSKGLPHFLRQPLFR